MPGGKKAKKKTSWMRLRRRRPSERVADFLTSRFGSLWFLIVNGLVFVGWIVINVGYVKHISPFDPFPFNLLTMVVSLEAIVLSVVVLISQNKSSTIEDIREEIDFRVNVEAEKEITKILHMLETIQRKLKIKNGHDAELKAMKMRLNIERIAEEVIEERRRA